MERITALRYKLHMFRVPIIGCADVLCDNKSLMNNTNNVESKLNKKHNSLVHHAVRQAVAASILKVGKIDTKDNISDALTKLLSAQERDHLFGNWIY